MHLLAIPTLIALSLSLTACVSVPSSESNSVQNSTPASTPTQLAKNNQTTTVHRLVHAYSRILVDPHNKQVINLDTLVSQLKESDVVFIGEFHGNQASHLLEMALMAKLYQQRPQQVLTLEMFNRDQQAILNRYLDGEIGEKYLINEAHTWPNYAGSYRPMIEFAKEHFIPVIAANASGDIVRCIGQNGQTYIDLLPAQEKRWIAERPFINNADYQQKFYDFLDEVRHVSEKRKQSSYSAQLARDNTMAESILKALQDTPEAQVIHLNGSFHSEEYLGTVAMLKQRRPDLNIAVISPVRVENPEDVKWSTEELALGDYVYFIRPQPTDYVNADYKRKARMKMFETSDKKSKQCIQAENTASPGP